MKRSSRAAAAVSGRAGEPGEITDLDQGAPEPEPVRTVSSLVFPVADE